LAGRVKVAVFGATGGIGRHVADRAWVGKAPFVS
jgi:short-subunit dehydrogenase